MQRKSYAYVVPGIAVFLAALLAGCTGGSGSDDDAGDAKQGGMSASAPAAKPGKYRTLPEPCAQPDKETLDAMLPGIKELTDERQRENAYEGTATATYDTDRRAGCGWKDGSATGGTHRLTLDFERVVSYGASDSDDASAQEVFASKLEKADLPTPVPTSSVTETDKPEKTDKPEETGKSEKADKTEKADKADKSGTSEKAGEGGKSDRSDQSGASDAGAESSAPASPSSSVPAAELQPRLLDGLGDEAFIDDELSGPEAARSRTVTVVFRTSNALVTIQYVAQSATPGQAPDSKESQDTVQELAQKLVGKFGE
ncbi:DUF3558 domain-containing protein [Streptomyces sp. NPDC102406]|uniref:DUF3558 domain-containing protein n=1 Tax=Streptomyces sp. NPDC102406 TaxID=3366171 RepID=UPI0038029AA2